MTAPIAFVWFLFAGVLIAFLAAAAVYLGGV